MQGRRSIQPFRASQCNQTDPKVIEQTGECGAQLRLQVLERGVLHLRLRKDPVSLERPSLSLVSPATGFERWLPDGASRWRSATTETTVVLEVEGFTVELGEGGEIVAGSWLCGETGCGLRLDRDPAEEVYGLGQRGSTLDHDGHRATLWNVDAYEHPPDADNLYQSCPFYLTVRRGRAYGVFLDSSTRTTFDFTRAHPEPIEIWSGSDSLDLFLLPGPTPAEVIERFTELVGRTPLPPLWALGYHQSRYSYSTEQEVLALARELRKRRIPCDVIHIDIDALAGLRSFHLCPDRFPSPLDLTTALREDGFHTVVIVDPGIRADEDEPVYVSGRDGDHFCRTSRGDEYRGEVWPGSCAFPDFSRAETRQWFGDLYRELIDQGIAGFWNDMNEPSVFDQESKTFPPDVVHRGWGEEPCLHEDIHNAYGHLMAQASHEGVARLRPERRVFLLTRSGYAGTQRYAATWTGDSTSTWEHLHSSLRQILSLGISGQPFAGSDIGGFSKRPTAELFTRWLEIGALMPFCRTHTEKLTPRQEPWSFGEPYLTFNRAAIQRRYRLLPYLYGLFYEAHRTGLPVARPLLLEFPHDRTARSIDDQLLLGPDLLVAPVLEPGAGAREIYFPSGTWVHLERDEVVLGPTRRTVAAPLGQLPVFVRAGSILPVAGGEPKHTGELELGRFLPLVVGENEACGRVYEDDGHSLAYRDGSYRLLEVRAEITKEDVQLSIRKLAGDWRTPDLPSEVEIWQVSGERVDRARAFIGVR